MPDPNDLTGSAAAATTVTPAAAAAAVAPDPISPRRRAFAEKHVLRRARGQAVPVAAAQNAAQQAPARPATLPPGATPPPPVRPAPASPQVPRNRQGLVLAKRQVATERAQYADLAQTMQAVKAASFPEAQHKQFESLDLKAGSHFKDYLSALGKLTKAKAAVDARAPTPPDKALALSNHCLKLIESADAYLAHYDKDLSAEQKADKTSLSKKRICETGRLSAFQYMMALDFDGIGGPPTDENPWNETSRLLAANVRARTAFHEGYKTAATLGDTGDKAGQSESRWVQRGTLSSVDDGKGGRDWQTTYSKDAIFKPVSGEKAADRMRDKPGAGAVKEALASGNARLFGAMTGLDLGVPETAVVSLNRYALAGGGPPPVDGNGKALNDAVTKSTDDVIGSIQSNAGATAQLDNISLETRNQIPKSEVHKVMLLDLMSLTVDRHPGNLMIKFDPDSGAPGLVPIDHGGSLPTRDDFPRVKNRFAGGMYSPFSGLEITNVMLKTPAAFEPIDATMQQQLADLQPDKLEAGMKAQRDAIDQVHPALRAADKVFDESFHMSRRTLQFTKLAASQLSPAAIQLAIHQHGEALFDATDADFDRLARNVIAEQLPKSQAYEEFFLSSTNRRIEIADWLEHNGWKVPTEVSTPGDAMAFLLRDPELALKLYKAKKPNPNAVDFQEPAVPDTTVDFSDVSMPDHRFRARMAALFPPFRSPERNETHWKKLVAQMALMPGGVDTYERTVQAVGAKPCDFPQDALQAMLRWVQLPQAEKDLLVATRLPGRQHIDFKDLLTNRAAALQAAKQAPDVMAAAAQAAVGIDDQLLAQNGFNDALDRIDVLLGDMGGNVDVSKFVSAIRTLRQSNLAQQPATAERQALALERDVTRFALDRVAADVTALKDRFVAANQFEAARKMYDECMGSCFDMQNLKNAKLGLTELRELAKKLQIA